jgi:Flp pilus assembly protein TadG
MNTPGSQGRGMRALDQKQQTGDTVLRAGQVCRQEGQSLVEAAVIVPILLLLLAAVVDFGRAFDAYIVLTNAAREGARFASLAYPLTESEIQQLVIEDVVGSGTNITNMTEFTTANVLLESTESDVAVTVSYDFDLWFGGIIGLDTIPLSKTAVMARAQ